MKIRIKKKCLNCYIFFLAIPSEISRGRGKFCSHKCYSVSEKTTKLGELNPMWKGDKVLYGALHLWIKSRLKKPKKCSNCNKISKNIDLANISQKYKRDLKDWEWLCRRCHMISDGRMKIFLNSSRNSNASGRSKKKGLQGLRGMWYNEIIKITN